MIELIAFLGNPGQEYAKNRHNAGRLLAECLAFAPALNWQKKYKGLYAGLDPALFPPLSGQRAEPVRLLMPETYMNRSGESIQAAASFFRIPPDRILAVHDELELPLGTAALKFSGGLGGHNGLRSLKACLGTADFWRLRLGIGRPNHEDISGWVLSDFSAPEREILEEVFPAAAAALTQALAEGPETLLPEWNKKRIARQSPAPLP
ncbi:MAG: aminoacyl-tRNA hydrolase [Treponema sp.]|jgi:PTH1 family peptidyl-tRNA hydrolase|nr:aminoacyl-tRNA hydrolase [Treponema sp.]